MFVGVGVFGIKGECCRTLEGGGYYDLEFLGRFFWRRWVSIWVRKVARFFWSLGRRMKFFRLWVWVGWGCLEFLGVGLVLGSF